MIAGMLAIAAIVAGIGLTTSSTLVYVLAFMLGAAQITLAQNALISVHSATADEVRGRVMGLWVMTFQGSSLLGAILAGVLADIFGVRAAMVVAGFGLAVIGAGASVAIGRADWRMQPVRSTAD